MDPQQYSAYLESIALCKKLINQLREDRAEMRRCMQGDMLKAYEKATDKAIDEVEKIQKDLRRIQSMQQ